tara:strand:+ start:1736 stop:2059 length:324 start_codon:yes stop_codon:yes gene_type:complete
MTVSEIIVDNEDEIEIFLTLVIYQNAIQISLYDDLPKLGSMSLAYPINDFIDQISLFTGKHEELSATLSTLLAKKTNRIIYASVNLKEHIKVDHKIINKMIDNLNLK